MSMESSSKKGFRPSRLLKLSSSRTAPKQSLAGRPKMLSPGKQTIREDQLPRRKIAPPTEDKSSPRTTQLEDADPPRQKPSLANGNNRWESKNTRGITRRHTLGGPHCPTDSPVDAPAEAPTKEPTNMNRKREAFLEHLKQKYPHHASTIMGHQERPREQSKNCQPPAGDQVDHISAASLDSLDAMSEGEIPPGPPTFTRGSRMRASLPVVRSTNQTRDRSLGMLYLQYGDETKQIHMPNEITSLDTILALFVSAFPQHLSMKMLELPTVAVYIRDDTRNMYYELTDIRAIADQTCLKVYHRDPTQAFSRKTHSSNGDLRVQQTGREGQSLISPPVARGLSPPISSSRIPFGPHGSCGSTSTMQRERLSGTPSCTPALPGTSAILERRDVKPDEDSPVMLSPLADVVDHRVPGSSLYSGPPPAPDPAEHPSLYRQTSRRHGDSQLPTLGTRTPPSSPHKSHQTVGLEWVIPGSKIQSGVTSEFSDPQTRERMKAMEKQIASLTGLVQHALLIGPNAKTAKAANSEKSPPVASPAPSMDSVGGSPDPATGPASLRSSLLSFGRSVSDLRQELRDLRQLQLQNQESLKQMLQRVEQEIGLKVAQTACRSDDPAQRQRTLVEEERHKYLGVEEGILLELGELERSVQDLKENCDNGSLPRPVTLREVEDCAVHLRSIGEALTTLRNGFPALQAKMRAVLRVEVEAVRFLKEEPHKLESMMKRVKILTDRLGTLRRYTMENKLQYSKVSVDEVAPKDHVPNAVASEPIASKETSPVPAHASPPTPVVPPEAPTSPHEPCSSPVRSEVIPTSPVVVHRTCSSPVLFQRSQHSTDLSCHSQDPPQSTKSSPSLRKHSPTDSNGSVAQGQFVRSRSKAEQRAASIAAAQLEWEEQQWKLNHYDRTDFEKLLQEAQDSLMMSIPSLEVADQKAEAQATPPVEAVDTPPSVAPPPEETPPLEPATKDHAKLITDTPTEILTETPTQPSLDNGGLEQGNKSPPPPPPRRTHPPGSGLTTGRSGEVIYKTRKDPVAPQEEEGAAVLVLQSKPSKTPPKPATPPPIAASALQEDEDDEDDEGNRIMAELQVFQKCTVQDVAPRCLVESPLGELWPGEDEQNKGLQVKGKHLEIKENGSNSIASPRVLYYDTDKMSKGQLSPGPDDPKKRREGAAATSVQVHSANAGGSAPGIQRIHTGSSPAASGCPWVEGQSRLPRAQCTYRRTQSLPENIRIQKDLKTGSPASVVQSKDDTPVEKRGREQERSGLTPTRKPWTGGAMIQEGSRRPDLRSQESSGNLDLVPEALSTDRYQVAVLRPSRARVKFAQEAVASPALPCEEATPASDNIAFKITDTEVQALSFGEYEEIMSTEGGNVETVRVSDAQHVATQVESGLGKKPVIIILDEPMDIRSAYKRLSTIFEGEEDVEPDQRLAENRIEEVPEENDLERDGIQVNCPEDGGKIIRGRNTQNYRSLSNPSSTHHRTLQQEASCVLTKRVDDVKQDPKKKFKLKFPKKKLTALSQAIQTGTKTGKKTLQVVVYEDEEEPDGTVKMAKEAKRFEIGCHGSSVDSTATKVTEFQTNLPNPQRRSDEFCQSASLEPTSKQLDASRSMCPLATKEATAEKPRTTPVTLTEPVVKDMEGEGFVSPNGATPPAWKAIRTPQPKFSKPQLPPRPTVIPHSPTKSHQNAGLPSAASPSPSTTPRARPASADKAGKQQQQQFLDPQRQFQQANGSARKAVGDAKAPSPTFAAFKIPAFDPSSGQSSSPSAANPEATNLNSSVNDLAQTHHSSLSLTQPFPAGSPRLPSTSTRSHKYQPGAGSAQSQNGRLQPSPSPLSSPSPSQGVKSISARATSFTCYKLQGRDSGKATLVSAVSNKDV